MNIKNWEKFNEDINTEKCFNKLSDNDIQDIINEDDLDEAMRIAQGVIGQDDGGVCGIYFSELEDADTEWTGFSPEERLVHLKKYMELEDIYNLKD